MLFSESAIKSTHFIQLCGKRGLPLIFLHNITGFIIGTTYEQGGITKDGSKMINAVTNVPVPKISIVCGGSFGAGNYAMCGPAFEPRFTFLWPNSRISVMGGEQAAGVVAIVKQNQLQREGKDLLSPEMEAALKKPIIDSMENTNSAWHSSAGVYDDGIIDPRDTRKVLAMAISISLNAPLPENNYGVFRM
jgi:3-methylcrotonyl-CoA carboxylase beta subunit